MSSELTHELSDLVAKAAASAWPAVALRLIEAQVLVESGGDPRAVSPAGAVGLLQIMPATAAELGVDPAALKDPEANLHAGITYLRRQFSHFPEIPHFHECISFALASYNCGRGYVNKALALAREACGLAGGQAPRPGPWQTWEMASAFLADPRCVVNGRPPRACETLTYVAKIRATFWRLANDPNGRES